MTVKYFIVLKLQLEDNLNEKYDQNLPNQNKKKEEIVFSYSTKVILLRKLLSLELMTAHTLWWNRLFRFSRWGGNERSDRNRSNSFLWREKNTKKGITFQLLKVDSKELGYKKICNTGTLFTKQKSGVVKKRRKWRLEIHHSERSARIWI